ncbi:MAG: hypothetical protein WED10_05680 [Brumimicrobium sp.]
MKQLYLNSILLICIMLLSSSINQNKETNFNPSNDVKFGVKIGLLPTGGLTQFAIFYYKNNRLSGRQPITKKELVNICTGKWPIPRTTKFYDFFEEQQFYNDSLKENIIDYGAAIDSLWKVRFSEHPLQEGLEKGWSQGDFRPSLKQQEYIFNRYGVRGYDQDYFSDSSFYKLLKDVVDPEWIAHYKSLR